LPRTGRSRGPWLASGLCCPAGSSLTMASSEALVRSCRFPLRIRQVFASIRQRPERPCFYLPVLVSMPSSIPRRSGRALTVGWSSVLAFATFGRARQPQEPRKSRFTRGTQFRGCKVRFMLGPGCLLASHRRRLLHSSFHPIESPHWNVEYDYAGKQSIPAAGLPPAGHAAL